jgi:hypothetical protein
MVDEVSCAIAGKRLAHEGDRADGSGLSIIDKDTHHIAARIAQKLRDAGFECAIVNLVPIDSATIRRHVILRTAGRKTGHPSVRKWPDAF